MVGSGVAANAVDRYVFGWSRGNRKFLLVVTESGEVWAHELALRTILPAFKLGGSIQRRDGRVRWVIYDGNRGGLYVVRSGGDVVWHSISVSSGSPSEVSRPATVAVPSPVGVNLEDQRVLLLRDRVFVFRSDGAVGFHRIISATRWSVGQGIAPESFSPIANQPQDKWLIPLCNDRIAVITSAGEVFVHPVDYDRNIVVAPAHLSSAQPVAINPGDRFVVSLDRLLYVIVQSGDVFAHPVNCF